MKEHTFILKNMSNVEDIMAAFLCEKGYTVSAEAFYKEYPLENHIDHIRLTITDNTGRVKD